MTEIIGVDPRTGTPVLPGVQVTTQEALTGILTAADSARAKCANAGNSERAAWLSSLAHTLDDARQEIVELADRETGLGVLRLNGELDRTIGQIGLFVDVLADGSFLEVIVDDADSTTLPLPRPSLRRAMRPVGPVAVWAASNFPFAFGVVGGDTVSALAAGCPVVVKSHPSQPLLSASLGQLVVRALSSAGTPPGTFAVVHGMEAGTTMILDRRVKAASFTGSLRGGRALFDLACSRPDPIPFFGELGSINPVFVTPAAATSRARDIAAGLFASATLGVGQFCTKPGLVFVPKDSGIREMAENLFRDATPGVMLNFAMKSGFESISAALAEVPGVRITSSDRDSEFEGAWVQPRLIAVDASVFLEHSAVLTEECFGPLTVVVECSDVSQMVASVRVLPGSLTATIHGDDTNTDDKVADRELCETLLDALVDKAGRIVWNGWPTGVAVSWAMQHGGPFPASTSATTSVGATAISRFLRPVCYQNFPDSRLPAYLRDGNVTGVMRLNGAPVINQSRGRHAP